eukprot:CAMPEP_0170590148 /NCGR_PEP_ID=MMETSP0224-20130122/11714_1 /TAXON_ID=285029 /ORGANISM="Togula jolla, Strain CCCM 725" /LENGTH=232 /DNA_ID=CAMNT_0010913923 /DNA_START=124 /DNA_END=822 /DNA_ORIENTATION=-
MPTRTRPDSQLPPEQLAHLNALVAGTELLSGLTCTESVDEQEQDQEQDLARVDYGYSSDSSLDTEWPMRRLWASAEKGRDPMHYGFRAPPHVDSDPSTPSDVDPRAATFPLKISEPCTTLMIRDIPCRIIKEDLLAAVDSFGFAGTYDFCHLPTVMKKKPPRIANFGYAFLNFISPLHASAFVQVFAGFRFEGIGSTKRCTIMPARLQGYVANKTEFRRKQGRQPLSLLKML